jgi:FtsP/CotA-like multicopper oxidase with cupredoxin domain
MNKRQILNTIAIVFILITLPLGIGLARAQQAGKAGEATPQARMKQKFLIPAKRKQAAARFQQIRAAKFGPGATIQALAMEPGGIPHYFGPFPNYAYSPLPKGPVTSIVLTSPGTGYSLAPLVTITDLYGTNTSPAVATASVDPATGAILGLSLTNFGLDYTAPVVSISDPTGTGASATAAITPAPGTGIKKFVDPLPSIPVAVPDTISYPGSDYYEISLRQYTERMHPSLPLTTLRGYVQTNDGTDGSGNNTIAPAAIQYLGPIIVAQRDRPVRIKFTNELPTGTAGELFIPVDTTLMGAGMAPNGTDYAQNRAVVHLHGNNTAWISDGTPHQWITPAAEPTVYKEGVSVSHVPDMWYDPDTHVAVPAGTPGATNDPGPGSATLYYTNAQSARLMFYHDHALGITRLNVYVGMAAGYLVTDDVEQDMINGTNVTGVNPTGAKVLPGYGIPLVIQDKTFVDAEAIAGQDPTWKWGTTPTTPHTGDLWFPHVYMPNQNPDDPSGMNAFGRWHYGPWFWPPATGITYGPIENPYFGDNPWEPALMPATPNPSTPGEAFMDTPVVNGEVYPYLEVDPKAYRFRILNAANDRFFNLQLYEADPAVVLPVSGNSEVKMVPAVPTAGFPADWPTDGREGGVPDPATAGPDFIQIGTEGGFLPAPVVLSNQPILWNFDQTNFDFGNIKKGTLQLGTAERADVIVDFSAFAGKTLILYNDAPAPYPAIDPRYDYYTGNPDQTDIGGTPSTQPGYGPNTRTIMQIRVRAVASDPPYDLGKLEAVFAHKGGIPGTPSVFEASQDPVIVPQAAYNSAYSMSLPSDPYVRIHESSKSFKTLDGYTVTIPMQPKAIQDEMGEAFDTEYGRMSAMLGLELPASAAGAQNFMLYPFASPPVEIIRNTTFGTPLGALEDGTQLWRITHNGVDTHTIHTHLFNAQIINRVAWDNAVRPPDPNELGWKETFRVNPLQDTILALRPIAPTNLPFRVPNSIRPIDPTKALGAPLMPPLGGFKDPNGNPVTVSNHLVNMGWEYVYHCHLLAHEEMDMMHAVAFAVAPEAPSSLVAVISGNGRNRSAVLNWTDNSITETSFTVQRATDEAFTGGLTEFTVGPDVRTYSDRIGNTNQTYYYRVYANNTVGDTATPGFPTETMNSPFSNAAGVNLPPAAPFTVAAAAFRFNNNNDRVTVTWTDGSNNETGFQIQMATDAAFTVGLSTSTVNVNVQTYTSGNVPRGATYYFRVRAINASGVSAWVTALPFPVTTP